MNQPSEGRRACVTDSDDNDNDNDNDEAELVVPSDGERCILHRSLALPSTLFPTLSSPVGPHASTTPSHSLLFRLEATRSGAEARFACCKTKRIPFPFAAGTTASTQYQRHAPPMRRTHPLPPDIFAVLPRAVRHTMRQSKGSPACTETGAGCRREKGAVRPTDNHSSRIPHRCCSSLSYATRRGALPLGDCVRATVRGRCFTVKREGRVEENTDRWAGETGPTGTWQEHNTSSAAAWGRCAARSSAPCTSLASTGKRVSDPPTPLLYPPQAQAARRGAKIRGFWARFGRLSDFQQQQSDELRAGKTGDAGRHSEGRVNIWTLRFSQLHARKRCQRPADTESLRLCTVGRSPRGRNPRIWEAAMGAYLISRCSKMTGFSQGKWGSAGDI